MIFILFAAMILAGAFSVQRRGAVTVGIGVLIIPLAVRATIFFAASGVERRAQILKMFDYALIATWICFFVLILVFGTVPDNSHVGWPD